MCVAEKNVVCAAEKNVVYAAEKNVVCVAENIDKHLSVVPTAMFHMKII